VLSRAHLLALFRAPPPVWLLALDRARLPAFNRVCRPARSRVPVLALVPVQSLA
jgi:hypothetical protein